MYLCSVVAMYLCSLESSTKIIDNLDFAWNYPHKVEIKNLTIGMSRNLIKKTQKFPLMKINEVVSDNFYLKLLL